MNTTDDIVLIMIEKASQALNNSYAPYSNFRVAACIQSEGEIFVGVNVENASYGLSICAESSAICQMIAKGKNSIENIVILSDKNTLCPPCGACRQRIYEFSNTKSKIYLCDNQGILKETTPSNLLPEAFQLKTQI